MANFAPGIQYTRDTLGNPNGIKGDSGVSLDFPVVVSNRTITTTASNTSTFTLPEGFSLSVSGASSSTGTVTRTTSGGTAIELWAISSNTLLPIGPFKGIQYFTVVGSTGTITSTIQDATISSAKGYMFATPEDYGARGDGVNDDTVAMQNLFSNNNNVSFRPGANYKITSTIVLGSGTVIIQGNGARMNTSFGTAYSTACFSNNKTTDSSLILHCYNLNITGNCVGFDMRFTANNPGAGLQLIVNNIYYQTYDGNRRAGTSFFVADQIDFMDIRNVNVWNCDLGFQLGSFAPRRNCTQLQMTNMLINQCSTIGYIAGVDKMVITNVDSANCNSGIVFAGSNSRILLQNSHLEGLGGASYPAASARVTSSATSIGYFFAPTQQNYSIEFRNCDIIDLGTTGGNAIAGVYIGDCINYAVLGIKFINCTFAIGAEGSSGYRAIRNRGKFEWDGPFPFSNTDIDLSLDGYHYMQHIIKDTQRMQVNSPNLLSGNSVLALMDNPSSLVSPPTMTEITYATSQILGGYDVTWNGNWELVKVINLPRGWITIDTTGYAISGNPLLFVEQNGSPYVNILRIQFNGLNDFQRRWVVSFWNNTSNLAYKVGFKNQNATAGVDKMHVAQFAIYAGFYQHVAPSSPFEIVSALPAATNQRLGKRYIVRTNNTADAEYVCLNNASNTPSWVLK